MALTFNCRFFFFIVYWSLEIYYLIQFSQLCVIWVAGTLGPFKGDFDHSIVFDSWLVQYAKNLIGKLTSSSQHLTPEHLTSWSHCNCCLVYLENYIYLLIKFQRLICSINRTNTAKWKLHIMYHLGGNAELIMISIIIIHRLNVIWCGE